MEDQVKNSILIVDDEKANLLALNEILNKDHTIFMARDGHEAIERANESLPDLILLDIIMPGMDGYEVLSILKKSEKTKDIPVIFITGLGGSDDEIKGLTLGADDYIAKPFLEMIVKLRVKNLLKIGNQMRIIERLSMTDKLTELPNRRSFDKQLNAEWRRGIRDKLYTSLLMIDVDKFKVYNDTYGHQQGDVVLIIVAKTIAQTLKRVIDFPSRWGGEEFSVLLPSTDKDGANMIAEQIRSNVELLEVPYKDNIITKVTVSIGVNTQLPSMYDSIDEFVARADKALYRAKKEGRNRVLHHMDITIDDNR